jgi:hypothetical protein
MMVSSYISLELDRGNAHQQAQEKEHGAHRQNSKTGRLILAKH